MPLLDDRSLAPCGEGENRGEDVWDLLDRTSQEDGAEEEAAQDLVLMREDGDRHLTAAIATFVLRSPEDEASAKVALPHLCRCAWCRNALRETLELCGTEEAHPAYALLNEAEEWARWEEAGKRAALSARQHLQNQGVGVVYAEDGAVWEEGPGGARHRVGETRADGAASR